VQALVDCVAGLLQRQNTDVGILDGQQFQNALAKKIFGIFDQLAANAAKALHGGRWVLHEIKQRPP
jgi:hypothetical protein